MPAYLITGGCGFIGSHLADALIAGGHTVRILDNLSTGKRENAPAPAEILVGDITDPATVAAAMQGIDGCFHLAAIASVDRSRTEWGLCSQVNGLGTVHVLDAAAKAGAPVVYASSAAVYGDNPQTPVSETAQPRPLTAYGADKLSNELQAAVAWHVHGLPTTGLRFFNVYGPRQDPASPYSGVISIFARKIADNAAISVHGDGQQTRDFVFVSDVAAALVRAMETNREGARVMNVCTGVPSSITELAAALQHVAGRSVTLQHGPARVGDIRTSLGNPARMHEALNLKAQVALREGLRITHASLA